MKNRHPILSKHQIRKYDGFIFNKKTEITYDINSNTAPGATAINENNIQKEQLGVQSQNIQQNQMSQHSHKLSQNWVNSIGAQSNIQQLQKIQFQKSQKINQGLQSSPQKQSQTNLHNKKLSIRSGSDIFSNKKYQAIYSQEYNSNIVSSPIQNQKDVLISKYFQQDRITSRVKIVDDIPGSQIQQNKKLLTSVQQYGGIKGRNIASTQIMSSPYQQKIVYSSPQIQSNQSQSKLQHQMVQNQRINVVSQQKIDPQVIVGGVKYDQSQNILLRKNPLVIENNIWRTNKEAADQGKSIRNLQQQFSQQSYQTLRPVSGHQFNFILQYLINYKHVSKESFQPQQQHEHLYHFLSQLKKQTDQKLKQLSFKQSTIQATRDESTNFNQNSQQEQIDDFQDQTMLEQKNELKKSNTQSRRLGRNQRPFSAAVNNRNRIQSAKQQNLNSIKAVANNQASISQNQLENQGFQNNLNDPLNTTNRSQTKRGVGGGTQVLQKNSLSHAFKSKNSFSQSSLGKNLKSICIGNPQNQSRLHSKEQMTYQELYAPMFAAASPISNNMSNKQTTVNRLKSPNQRIMNQQNSQNKVILSQTPGTLQTQTINQMNQDLNQMLVEEDMTTIMESSFRFKSAEANYNSQRVSRPQSKYRKRTQLLGQQQSKQQLRSGNNGKIKTTLVNKIMRVPQNFNNDTSQYENQEVESQMMITSGGRRDFNTNEDSKIDKWNTNTLSVIGHHSPFSQNAIIDIESMHISKQQQFYQNIERNDCNFQNIMNNDINL